MKQYILFASLISMLAALFSGCNQDVNDSPFINTVSDYEVVNFNISLACKETNDSDTRSSLYKLHFSDGSCVNTITAYVYNQEYGDGSGPVIVKDLPIVWVGDDFDKHGANVSFSLPKGEKFDVVFLATSYPLSAKPNQCGMSYSATDRIFTIDYAKYQLNYFENMDCFYAVQKDVSTDSSIDNNVVLTRPLAQINIGSMDIDKFYEDCSVPSWNVSVDGIYSSFNVMDGSVAGDPITGDFRYDNSHDYYKSYLSEYAFPKEDYDYIAMQYVLVNLRKTVDVSLTINRSGKDPLVLTFNNVAVERNYQSNIYGKELLTNPMTE